MPAQSSNGLLGKRWELVELNGQPVQKLAQVPYFTLEGDRISGFGGCNNFSGTYSLDAGASRIRFSQLTSTLKACIAGMDVEKALQDVLGRADNYSLSGDSLTLNRARMAPLARFKAASSS